MRLLNARTLKFHEFSRNPPRYSILSHTWGWDEDEVSYRDIIDSVGAGRRAWSQKVIPCAARVIQDGYEYVWIDTCCIDKSSTVEVSEAINSMYRWYHDAQQCYVALLDVPVYDTDPQANTSKFCQSRWFTRGWTLQELLMPKIVYFFNAGWKYLGSRNDLAPLLWNITGIGAAYLTNNDTFQKASIAVRIYWASRRETKRPEDQSYSLLGLFGVSMPPIYGEGAEQAFLRLQKQILETQADDSILAWGISPGLSSSLIIDKSPSSLLAQSPSDFLFSGDVAATVNDSSTDMIATSSCIVTSTTALFQIRAYRCETEPGYGYIKLKCRLRVNDHGIIKYRSIAMPIAWSDTGGNEVCFRVRHPNVFFFPINEGVEEKIVTLYVHSRSSVLVRHVAQFGTFRFLCNAAHAKITAMCPKSAWNDSLSGFTFEAGSAVMAVRLSCNAPPKKDYVIVVVLPTREFTTYARWLVMEDTENTPLEAVVSCWVYFRNSAKTTPFNHTLTREISIRTSYRKPSPNCSYVLEVLPGGPSNPPHPAYDSVGAEMKYLKMSRKAAAIDMEVKKLLDAKSALTVKMKEMDQKPLPALVHGPGFDYNRAKVLALIPR